MMSENFHRKSKLIRNGIAIVIVIVVIILGLSSSYVCVCVCVCAAIYFEDVMENRLVSLLSFACNTYRGIIFWISYFKNSIYYVIVVVRDISFIYSLFYVSLLLFLLFISGIRLWNSLHSPEPSMMRRTELKEEARKLFFSFFSLQIMNYLREI